MMHLLDANVFMEANRLYYPIDLAPKFWSWLTGPTQVGYIGSIDRVKKEILEGQPKGPKAPPDPLAEWVRTTPASFWVKANDDVATALKQLATWVNSPDRIYKPAAVAEFFASADMQLIAQGMSDESVVVTREQPAPESTKRVKIPDVCAAFGVSCIDPFTLYRQRGLQLN